LDVPGRRSGSAIGSVISVMTLAPRVRQDYLACCI
jgi:hypothetical protein